MCSIIIVEDDIKFLSILCKLLNKSGFTVLETFNNGTDFLNYINKAESYPDLCIFDLELPDLSGLEIIKNIQTLLNNFVVLILTSFSNEDVVFEAVKYGSSGYILKKDLVLKLKDTITEVLNGGIVIEPILARKFLNYFKTFKTTLKENVKLSEDEKDILIYLVKGFTYNEIANFTNKTPRNIKYTLSQIYKKLNTKSRVEAVAEAVRLGVIEI